MSVMDFCKETCGENTICVYEVCPFLHEYTYEGEIVSGYRYVGTFDDEENEEL